MRESREVKSVQKEVERTEETFIRESRPAQMTVFTFLDKIQVTASGVAVINFELLLSND